MRVLLLVFIMVFGFCLLPFSNGFTSPKGDSERIMSQAQEKEEAGDYEGAQSLYEGVLHHDPENLGALSGLAQVQYWQGNYEEAVKTYEKVLELDSKNVPALVGTGKAYLAMGKQKKARDFFDKAEKIEPGNEESEAVQPQLERKSRIVIEGGYITENPSYSSQTQGEFQQIRIEREKTYGLGLYSAYIQRFGRDGFDTRLFGHYYLKEKTRFDLSLGFAPEVDILPRQNYEVGIAHTIWKVTPEFHYRFQDFTRANTHTLRPALFFEPMEFLRIGGGYEFQNLMVGTTSRNFHGGFAELKVVPTEFLSIYGFYSYAQRGFEAGRIGNPFVNYKAHIGGGGVQFEFLGAYSVGFEAEGENRNNRETSSSYRLSLGYVF